MSNEIRNKKEREKYNEKIKDAAFKENKRKKDLEYYHKTKDIRISKQIGRRKELLTEAKEKLGGKCVWCETTKNLQFDHINDAIKKYNVANAVRNTREVFWNEVEKCQLLCYKCHNKKSAAQRKAKQDLWLSLPFEEREILLNQVLGTVG
jgi:5-methylcytosine-specific restriction endonuclease McrA